ncbi:type II toxin-antitoxin system ParD family antitoxin [Aureimonas sp. N4]|uniref:type II toxin-antitoxin system ParD family antitoxin n=1 Tax=Aureimonas sp. N4 TaxID=1638165 RepID=UPI0007832C19|nr:type II toxin-antitoxin system ParD family antitoxin [Aureimonas sp. N4]
MANVTVGKHYENMVQRMVQSGRYASVSEVHREGLRLIEEREQAREAKLEALRTLIAEGDASGTLEPMESAAELKAEARRQRAKEA